MSKLIDAADVLREQLENPEFRALWERSALRRAVALWLVAYRADHDLTIDQLAARVGWTADEVLDLEACDVEPLLDRLLALSRSLGTALTLRVERGLPGVNVETIVVNATAAKAA